MPAIPAIIMGGAAIYGAHKAASAAKDAAKTQAGTDAQALDFQKEMFGHEMAGMGQSREDLSPYRSLGQGAAGLLGQGLGINMTPQTPAPQASAPMSSLMPPPTPQMPPNALKPELRADIAANRATPQAAAQQASASGYQRIVSPSGQTVMVPPNMVQKALSSGGRMAQ